MPQYIAIQKYNNTYRGWWQYVS